MTSQAPAVQPLRSLPEPPALPRPDVAVLLPEELLMESRGQITRRLLRLYWVPALVLWAVWIVLVLAYVLGASPTIWLFGLLGALGGAGGLSTVAAMLDFTLRGIGLAVLIVPILGAAASLATLPLSSLLIARLRPREHLSEEDFQAAVRRRATIPLLIPPLAVIAVLLLLVAVQAPLEWSALGAGPLSAVMFGIATVMLAGAALRGWLTAPRILGIPSVTQLQERLYAGLRPEREAAARQLSAQDRRHLPPNTLTLSLRMLLPSAAATGRAWLVWVIPAALGTGWLMLVSADLIITLSRLLSDDLTATVPRTELPWITYPLGIGLLLVAGVLMAAAPLVAMRLAEPLRDQVSDLRTYPRWTDRALVNPWEKRAVLATGWMHGAIVAGAAVVLAGLLAMVGAATGISWAWLVIDVLVLAPLAGLAGAAAMREALRTMVYGPAGRFMRRDVPWELVALPRSTRAEQAEDPLVRARRREQQEDPHGLAVGETVSLSPEQARAAQALAEGRLPSFGAADPGAPAPRIGAGTEDPHRIPSSDTELRRR